MHGNQPKGETVSTRKACQQTAAMQCRWFGLGLNMTAQSALMTILRSHSEHRFPAPSSRRKDVVNQRLEFVLRYAHAPFLLYTNSKHFHVHKLLNANRLWRCTANCGKPPWCGAEAMKWDENRDWGLHYLVINVSWSQAATQAHQLSKHKISKL